MQGDKLTLAEALQKVQKNMILYHLNQIHYKKWYQTIIGKNVKIKKNLNKHALKKMILIKC